MTIYVYTTACTQCQLNCLPFFARRKKLNPRRRRLHHPVIKMPHQVRSPQIRLAVIRTPPAKVPSPQSRLPASIPIPIPSAVSGRTCKHVLLLGGKACTSLAKYETNPAQPSYSICLLSAPHNKINGSWHTQAVTQIHNLREMMARLCRAGT